MVEPARSWGVLLRKNLGLGVFEHVIDIIFHGITGLIGPVSLAAFSKQGLLGAVALDKGVDEGDGLYFFEDALLLLSRPLSSRW